jgi:hypothetical protein
MELKITKDQLRSVQTCVGKLNTDSGQVLTGVRGRRRSDGLYHLVVDERPVEAGEAPDQFSLAEILEASATRPAQTQAIETESLEETPGVLLTHIEPDDRPRRRKRRDRD